MQTQEIIGRAADLGWPLVVAGGGALQGERAWRAAAAIVGDHASLSAQLDALAQDERRRTDAEERRAAPDARRSESGTCDAAVAAEERAETAADFARRERERPRRIESLLNRILDALEKKR